MVKYEESKITEICFFFFFSGYFKTSPKLHVLFEVLTLFILLSVSVFPCHVLSSCLCLCFIDCNPHFCFYFFWLFTL